MKCLRNSALLSLLVFFTITSPTHSQCPPVHTFTGEAAGDQFGASVASAGDVNNDGYDDIIIGAYNYYNGSFFAGRAYVFSGQTADTLYVFISEVTSDPNDHFGYSVSSAGDVNNDGHDDVIIGAFSNSVVTDHAGRAYVFSGLTGDTLYVFNGEAEGDQFGYSVSSAGDVNNDGHDDVIIGAFSNSVVADHAGRAYVFSGQTGDTLYVFSGEAEDDQFGYSVSLAGDVNNDGHDDMIIGARGNNDLAGRAYVFSGQTGDTLFVFSGEAPFSSFGYSVSSARDTDNDGYDDMIIGAPDAGRAYLFSGQTGDILNIYGGEDADSGFGVSVASAGDVNNDGYNDVIIGAHVYGNFGGRAYVFSGNFSDTLYVFRGETAGDFFGWSVSSVGDIDNDGHDDVIIGAFGNNDYAGRAYVFSGRVCNCADANGDSLVNVDDVDFLIDFYFYGGATPIPYLSSDLNCDGSVNIADITYLAAYINGTGAAPCCAQ